MAGQAKANDIFSRGLHLLSAGNSDFIQNYYITPLLTVYTPDQFSDILIRSYSAFIQVTPHSHTHTHTHIYIYIYIFVHIYNSMVLLHDLHVI